MNYSVDPHILALILVAVIAGALIVAFWRIALVAALIVVVLVFMGHSSDPMTGVSDFLGSAVDAYHAKLNQNLITIPPVTVGDVLNKATDVASSAISNADVPPVASASSTPAETDEAGPANESSNPNAPSPMSQVEHQFLDQCMARNDNNARQCVVDWYAKNPWAWNKKQAEISEQEKSDDEDTDTKEIEADNKADSSNSIVPPIQSTKIIVQDQQ